jgi:hypothetical protein
MGWGDECCDGDDGRGAISRTTGALTFAHRSETECASSPASAPKGLGRRQGADLENIRRPIRTIPP